MPWRAGAWRRGEASPGTSSPQPALGAARAVPSRAGAGARSMAGLPGTVRPRSGSPGASAALPAPRLAALDGAFVCSPLGGLMGAQAVSTGRREGGARSWTPRVLPAPCGLAAVPALSVSEEMGSRGFLRELPSAKSF